MLSTKACIETGDVVALHEGSREQRAVTMELGKISSARHHYHHSDMLGKPYGSQVFPRAARDVHGKASNPGSVRSYILRPTAEAWTGIVNHRTQILYTADIAAICTLLELRPGSVVVEAGTGTGSLSVSILRAVSPSGHLFTFDFHEHRSNTARRDFEQLGLSRYVTATHRNVCPNLEGVAPGEPPPPPPTPTSVELPAVPSATACVLPPLENSTAPCIVATDDTSFGLPNNTADALFLDLPAPFHIINAVADVLKPNGMFCSFSPCIEQVQKTCSALRAGPFAGVRTLEVLQRSHQVRVVSPTPLTPEEHRQANESRKRKREEEETEEDAVNDLCDKEYRVLRPARENKGHTGYLTFARRLPV